MEFNQKNNFQVANNETLPVLKRMTFDSIMRIPLKGRPFIECHRGCNRMFPENSISAFKKAIELGCDSVEMDVWLTKDKIPVVIHGKTNGEIEETTNGQGCVKDFTFRELSEFILLGINEGIPTLESVLILCKDKIFVNIEIKDLEFSESFNKILNLVRMLSMDKQVAFSSFNHQYWHQIKKSELQDQIEFGFLYEPEDMGLLVLDDEKRNNSINISFIHVNHDIVKRAHEMNIAVHCWFNINELGTDENFRFLMDCGVDVICTNSPQLAMTIRDEVYGTS